MTPPNPDVDRLRAVYAGYDTDERAGARWSTDNAGNAAMQRERGERLRGLLGRAGLDPVEGLQVLDLGCGRGDAVADLVAPHEPRLVAGLDLIERRLLEGAQRHPGTRFVRGDGSRLPFADGAFDVVVLFTVLSSVLDDGLARAIAAEAAHVLHAGGAVAWYDMRFPNPWNPHVRRVGRRSMARLFPGFHLELRRATVLPPVARRLGSHTARAYPLLRRVPGMSSHTVGLLHKR